MKTEGPAQVPTGAKQAGEAGDRWSWVEPSAWSTRMLEALEKGVKGGVWFSLIDKVHSPRNLAAAYTKVKANRGSAGVDRQTIAMFERHRKDNLEDLERRLAGGTYRPHAVKRVWIPKAGKRELRPLGIPSVKDRIVQTAIRNVLEPIFERDFADCSYGFRPRRGCKDALRQVDALLQAGHVHVVDADIKGFFDTLSHDRLMQELKRKVADGRVLELIELYLGQQVIDEAKAWTPEEGTPQGAVISPLLSNIYLDGFDWEMQRHGFALVRYADDWVVMCKSDEEARQALDTAKRWMGEASLTLHPEKTRIVDLKQPEAFFDFLGFRFTAGGSRRYPTPKAVKKFRTTLKPMTKRSNGHSMEAIIESINRVIRGWFEYFKHAWITTFPALDGWVRGRLRSILRKRMKKKGRARGKDHQRWPNEYFAKLGLFSQVRARRQALQPLNR